MQANPILAEVVRGNWVENRHRGAFCVVDASGKVLASAGDVDRAIFPRSAFKAVQALAMFRSGAVDKFDLDQEMLALACASHHGQSEHIAGVERFLDRIGLTVDDLECGAHPPINAEARNALRNRGETPTAIHNTCSGKHAGMLAVARALGVSTLGYSRRTHNVQALVRECAEAVIGQPLSTDRCGVDGCSIPTWAAPLSTLAAGFARMASGEGLPAELAGAAATLFDAATNRPFLVAGTGAFDNEAMGVFGGRLMIKSGAEGVFLGALRDKGLGFALKCDDGNLDAAEVMAAELLASVTDPNEEQRAFLAGRAVRTLHNWRRIAVGHLMATEEARAQL